MGLTQVSKDGVKNDAIDASKLPANSVGASELADNAVDTNAIADQAVALSKLPHGDGSSNGKFLRANNGADPSFESIPAGTTINNNADNRVITGSGTANTLNAESSVIIDSSGKVGIGTATPHNGSKLTVAGNGLAITGQNIAHTSNALAIGQEGSGVAQLRAYGSGSTSYGHLDVVLSTSTGTSSNSTFKFIKQSASGNSVLRVPTNGGIQFQSYDEAVDDGSNSVNTNTLDDYEEGKFTPQMLFGGSESGVSYTERSGFYIKIGSLVYVKGSITLSNTGNAGGGASASIGNLPFTIRDDYSGSAQEGFGMLTYWGNTNATSNFLFWASQNGTAASIQRVNGATTVNYADKNDFANNADLRFSLFYCAN